MSTANSQRVKVSCTTCGKEVVVSASNLGKKAKCPACQQVFVLQAPPPEVSPGNFPNRSVEETNTFAATDTDEFRLQPLPGQLGASDSIFNQLPANPQPIISPVDGSAQPSMLTAADPSQAVLKDYLSRAKNYKSITEEQEEDPTHRFLTSYGAIIGGSVGILLGLIMIWFFFPSVRLMACGGLVVASGGGAILQGVNYVFYYRWKREMAREGQQGE